MVSKCVLPRLEVLNLVVTGNVDLSRHLTEHLVHLAAGRLKDPNAANLRSIGLSMSTAPSRGFRESEATLMWDECWKNALRLLVPEVKITVTISGPKKVDLSLRKQHPGPGLFPVFGFAPPPNVALLPNVAPHPYAPFPTFNHITGYYNHPLPIPPPILMPPYDAELDGEAEHEAYSDWESEYDPYWDSDF